MVLETPLAPSTNLAIDRVYPAIVAVLLVASFAYLTYGVEPAQREAGGWAQKIMYYHIPSSLIAFGCFFGGMLAAIAYLAWKDARAAWSGRAMVETGWLAATLVLVTGPIWAKSTWDKWWTWEPRLTTFAFLWFTYSAYLVLGPAVQEREKRRALQSVYAILAFLTVPAVIYSTRILPVELQQHPARVEMPPRMFFGWAAALVGLTALFAGLVHLRYRTLAAADRLEDLAALAHDRSDSRA